MAFSFSPKDYPASPGVYLMKNARGKIIYVGKAKSLRARLSSYFRRDAGQGIKTRTLVSKIEAVDTLLTATEKEALLLEASLIKKHRPRYNVVLRDDKQYILFKLDRRHEFPRLRFTRRVLRDRAAYFGPFTSAAAARRTWKQLNRVFPIRKCSDRALKNRVRPCLYHHINQCLAPCVLDVDREEYMELVRRVEAFLTGRSAEELRNVEKDMLAASEALEFERAAKLRDLLAAMKKTVEGQAVVLPGFRDLDVVGVNLSENGLGLCVLFVRQGRLLDRKTFHWRDSGETGLGEAVLTLLSQFYRPESFIPGRILLPAELLGEGGDGGGETLAEILAERRGGEVRLAAPRGKYEKKLMELAGVNAAGAVDEARRAGDGSLVRLAPKLKLADEPERIEVVDVSHLGGKGVRVGQVVFEHGRPKKKDYRVYAFDELEGTSDDYLALASWVKRRVKSGPPWPDLLVIDGGKGQLRAVERALEEADMAGAWELASIAKAGRGRAETGDVVFRPGRKNPLALKPNSPELLFVQRLRDAAHDFVISRQRRTRKKDLQSGLLELPGVGPKTARLLWEKFGSIEAMKQAGVEDFLGISGLGRKKAQQIFEALKRG